MNSTTNTSQEEKDRDISKTRPTILALLALLLPLTLPLLLVTMRPFARFFPPILYLGFPIAAVACAGFAIKEASQQSKKVIPITVSTLALFVSILEIAAIAYLLVELSKC